MIAASSRASRISLLSTSEKGCVVLMRGSTWPHATGRGAAGGVASSEGASSEAIAATLPGNAAELEKIPELSASDRRRWSSAILAAVKAGANHAAEYQPLAASVRPSADQKRIERLLWERLKRVCDKVDIPTAAVAAREDIRKLVRGEQDIRLLQGWRRQFAGRELRDLAAREGVEFTC